MLKNIKMLIWVSLVLVLCIGDMQLAMGGWTTVVFPGADHTRIHDIYGNTFVGLYTDASGDHAFSYDGINWTTLEFPGATSTKWAYGIEGENIVGMYYEGAYEHGFVFTIPEPSTLLLLGLGALFLRRNRS